MSSLYTNIFDSSRQAIWDGLRRVSVAGVLGGETAIALLLGHRISYDFDVFLPKSVAKSLQSKVLSAYSSASIKTLIDSGDELTITVDGVKLTYLHYPLAPTDSLARFDLSDSAANKAYAIGRRGAWRDYFDLYTLCTMVAYFWNQ